MKIDVSVLRDALKRVQPFLASSSALQVLEGVRLNAKNNVLEITANNLEQMATSNVEFEGDDSFDLVVSARIVDLVNSLKDGRIELKVEDSSVRIFYESAKKSMCKISGFSSDDYPHIKVDNVEREFKVNGAELKNALKSTLFSLPPTNSVSERPSFQGVYVCDGRIVTSDTYRASVYDFEFGGCCYLIPGKFFNYLIKNLPDDEVVVVLGDACIKFVFGNLIFISRLLNLEYPDISNVLSKEYYSKVSVDVNSLIEVLNRTFFINDSSNNAVNFIVNDSTITVKVSSEVGELEEVLSADVEGETFDVRVNAKFILDVLRVSPDEKITFCFSGKNKPFVVNWEGYNYLMMPIA